MPDIFDEIEVDSGRDIFDEVEYTPESQGFGDLKQAERGIERDDRRTALLAEQTQARQQSQFSDTTLSSLEGIEGLTKSLSTPFTGPIHGIRQGLGLESPDNPLPIVPPIPRLDPERVKSALPNAMPGVPEVVTGAQQAAAGFGDFLLNPDFVGLGGVGAVPKVLQSIAGSVFSGDMAKHTPEQAQVLGEASVTGTPTDVVRESLNTGMTLLGAAAPLAHALPKSTKAVAEKFEVERPGESKWSTVPERFKETEQKAEPVKDIFDEIKIEETADISAGDDLGAPKQTDRAISDSPITASFIGEEPGLNGNPPTKWYRIDKPIRDTEGDVIHSVDSTVSEHTLREHGVKFEETQPELVGMGGAVQSEFAPSSGRPTSIKNAQVDKERMERGLPPASEVLRRSFAEAHAEAMNRMDRDPKLQDNLIAELSIEKRPLKDWEDVVVLQRQTDLQNEQAKAFRELAQAHADGYDVGIKLANNKLERLDPELQQIYDIGKGSGTANARGLNARKMFMNDDFSLAKLTVDKQLAKKKGEPLTPEDRVEIQKIADEYKAKSEALEKHLADKDARISELEAQKTVSDIEKEVKASPYVIQVAEKYVARLEKRAIQAEKELQEIFSRTSMGVDPAILLKVTEIAAYHIAKKGLDFAKWSNEVTAKFGEKVAPYLEQAWKAAQTKIDTELDQTVGKAKSEPVKRAVKKVDSTATIEEIGKQVAAGAKIDLSKMANELTRKFAIEGERGMPIVDRVHETLKGFIPELTRRQTADALSGYGKYKQLSKDEISVELRDLRGQLQQLSKLEDMQAGKAPSKTGVERRTPSDEERRLVKLVEEAKKKGGYTVTDPAKQLKTALDAVKTRLKNQITDLEHQVATKEKIVKEKRGLKYDAEAEALRTRRDELKKEFEDIFGSRELTDEQRVRGAMSAVQRSIEDLEKRISTGDIAPRKPFSKTPQTPELVAAKARRDALRDQLDELRDLANPKKTPEELALKAFKTRTKNKIADLEERLAKGDFSKKEPVKYTPDKEAINLKYEVEKTKRRWNEALLKDKLKNRTTAQKVGDRISETLLFQKALKTAIDFSAVFRQGGFVALGNPIRAAKALPDMFRAMKSEKEMFAQEEAIYSRPNAPLYQEGKLFLSRHGEGLTKMEEAYLSRWADKVPIINHSARAYTAFLNRIRADSFDAMVSTLSKDGKPTTAEVKAIANFVNVATGRGSVGPTSNFGVAGMNIFFAPRYVVSRFQLIGGQPLYKGSARTRKLVAKEYAKFLTGLAVLYGLAKSAGGEVESDVNSSDFGKINLNDNVIDPLAGISQQLAFVGKMGTGEMKNTKTGEFTKIRGEVPYGKPDAEDIFWRYVRSKLGPSAAMTFDVTTGKNFDGSPVDWKSVAETAIVPINVKDVYEIMRQNNVPAGVALSIIHSFGMGVSPRKDDK